MLHQNVRDVTALHKTTNEERNCNALASFSVVTYMPGHDKLTKYLSLMFRKDEKYMQWRFQVEAWQSCNDSFGVLTGFYHLVQPTLV
jgi:hypothetical protein